MGYRTQNAYDDAANEAFSRLPQRTRIAANMRAAVAVSAAALLVLLFFVYPIVADDYRTAAVLTGIATVKDGDGVLFGNVEIRLQGIAAPETGEPGGAESTENLRKLVEGELLVCHLDGTTAGRAARPAGICYFGAADIGEYQVRTGHARDCPAYSGGRYAAAETAAKAAGIGLAATYELPMAVRRNSQWLR